jgi:hypothetical protein
VGGWDKIRRHSSTLVVLEASWQHRTPHNTPAAEHEAQEIVREPLGPEMGRREEGKKFFS